MGFFSPSEALGIYGKLPSQGDFFRLNASDQSAQALDIWVQEGLDALHRAGLSLPQHPVYFLHFTTSPQQIAPTLGVLYPSHDSAGRVYPLVIFSRTDLQWMASRFSAAPTAYGIFLRDAAQLASMASRLDGPALTAQASRLRLPSPSDLATVDGVCRHVLDQTASSTVHLRLFGPPTAGLRYYAFRTVIDAADGARNRTARNTVTLDLPLGGDVDLFVWLELLRRRLSGVNFLPSVVWVEESPAPRALVSLGAASGTMLRWLTRPDPSAMALWPATTQRPEAIHQAWQALAPHHRQALDVFDISLETLVSTLSR